MRPLDLYPPNPRFLRFRGEPTILITSAEHYGAVFNLDFDYHRYLSELQRCRFNYTRTASGTFVERLETIEGSGWENTQAPRPLRYLGPWRRSDQPGYAYGGTKFDLSEWEPAYFDRLRDFVHQAGLRGVIVEYTLFTAMYSPDHWSISPMHPDNVINPLPAVAHDQVYRVDSPLLEHHLRFARKAAEALADFDNVIIELVNEPYFAAIGPGWREAVLQTLTDTFADLGRKLPLAWNLANFHASAADEPSEISIFTFHYANPPTAVTLNDQLGKPVIYDETGYIGVDDTLYRKHAWEFLLAGGSGFNHLDYSYAPSGAEGGSRELPGDASGGGSRRLRDQLTVLRDFMAALPFAELTPTDLTVLLIDDTGRKTVRGLSAPGSVYAWYAAGDPLDGFEITAPPGSYLLTVVDPLTGFSRDRPVTLTGDGPHRIEIPGQLRELGVTLVRVPDDTTERPAAFDFRAAAHQS